MIDPNILIVDDEAANVALLEAILHRAGYVSVRGTTDSRQVARLVARSRAGPRPARPVDAVPRRLRRPRTAARRAAGGKFPAGAHPHRRRDPADPPPRARRRRATIS